MATITGKTICGNHAGQARRSCTAIDVPTGERVTVLIDGHEHERTVHERRVWRNTRDSTVLARFVTVNGTNYEIA